MKDRHVNVNADPVDLRTAVSNLLDNAIKYSRDQVEISCRFVDAPDDKLGVLLRVRAAAWVSPPEELGRFSNGFTACRGRTASQVKGTGLGLFIVRVDRKGARRQGICRERGRGSGTTVTLATAQERRVSRMLVVEDEAHLAKGLQFNLEAEKHSVDV